MPYLSNISAIAAKNGGWSLQNISVLFRISFPWLIRKTPGEFPTGARTAVDIMPMSLVSPQKSMDVNPGGSPMATGGNSNQKTDKNQ